MAFPQTVLQLTVADGTVTPQGPLAAGTAGDDAATRLNFYFETSTPGSVYRLEIVRGDGVYDLTAPLMLTPDSPELNFDIPATWTAAGTAAVRLVELTVENGEETQRRYYPPILLTFAYRDEGVPMNDAPLLWQSLLARAEATLNTASAAATAATADAAAATADAAAARAAAEQAAMNGNAAERAEAAAAYCESLVGLTAAIKATLGVG